MRPQSCENCLNEEVMASNGYSNAAAVSAKQSKNNSPPCESGNCMCVLGLATFIFILHTTILPLSYILTIVVC